MTDVHTTEIVPTSAPIVTQRMHPMVQAAMSSPSGISPEAMEKFMDLQERYEAGEARKLFTVALIALKSTMPSVIARDKTVSYGKGESATKYTYATLAAALEAVTEHLSSHGFSLTWSTSSAAPKVRVTCRLMHVGGHSEETYLDAPPDTKGGKNDAQAVASTVTMLQRYTALLLLGIATKDMVEPTGEAKGEIATIDPARNLAAVGELRKRGVDLKAVVAKVGRPVEQWTTADLDVVRGMLPKKAPRENADGSVDVDPPKT